MCENKKRIRELVPSCSTWHGSALEITDTAVAKVCTCI